MSVTPSSTIVGVFRDRSEAEQAVNALYNAGFGQEQIQYMVSGTSGSFFEGLKNFLTGTNEGGENLAGDLTGMGLPETDAEYYANEYNNGNPILVVKGAERGTEALNILRQYGAYNTQTEPAYADGATGDTQNTQQAAAYTQQDDSTAYMPSSGDYAQQSGYGAPGQHDNVQDLETESQQAPTGEEHPYAGAQPENATPDYDLSDQDTQIIAPQNDTYAQHMDAQAQDTQADILTPEPTYDTGNQVSGTDTATQAEDSETPASPLPSAAPQEYGLYQDAHESDSVDYAQASMTVPETTTGDQTTQADTTTPEQEYSSQVDQTATSAMTGYDSQTQQAAQTTPATSSQSTEMQPEQASAASPAQMDELQQLQAQLQSLQQQLQEAKDRLAAAKEQENQIRTAREREQQLQSARQQLQDVQAELQATLAEYQEVQSRITQYQ